MALSTRFDDALVYAARLHANQTRKGTTIPYIAHLLAVASIALEHGADEDTAIAALLHDAVEDQGGAVTRAEIQRRFGDKVTMIVDGCTDTDIVPKPPWRARKQAYIAHLADAAPETRLVSAADKLHNARAILSDYRRSGDTLWNRFNGGKDGTLWYYQALAQAFAIYGPADIAAELKRTVQELVSLAG